MNIHHILSSISLWAIWSVSVGVRVLISTCAALREALSAVLGCSELCSRFGAERIEHRGIKQQRQRARGYYLSSLSILSVNLAWTYCSSSKLNWQTIKSLLRWMRVLQIQSLVHFPKLKNDSFLFVAFQHLTVFKSFYLMVWIFITIITTALNSTSHKKSSNKGQL